MRGILTVILICLLLSPAPAQAFLKPKDYKQIFLNDAISAEQRNNHKSAFHSFEKAMYYYGKDRNVVLAYAAFCERNKYFDKAEKLYAKLYILTKDSTYLFKKDLCAIKNGKLSEAELHNTLKRHDLTQKQKNQLDEALIFHFSWKEDWKNVKKACDLLPFNSINKDVVTTCLVASERVRDKKASLRYSIRFAELFPKDSAVISKIIHMAEASEDYILAEKYTKQLVKLNPKDLGIRYELAGLYEKQKQWQKAAKLYESLMVMGDKSEHVKTSLAYVLSQMNPKKAVFENVKKEIPYFAKPLSGFKLSEKLFYQSWKEKKYDDAQTYLVQMLKEQPNSPKLLKHGADISLSQENYPKAIDFMQRLKKVKPLLKEEEKFLAFLYFKKGDISKSLEIVEEELKKAPEDKELLKLALEYSLAAKNWDSSIVYNLKLLEFEPKSETLLKQGGDLHSIKKDFESASKLYERLVELYPKLEYKTQLANFYMASKEYEKAQAILEPIYYQNPGNEDITKAYLNTLFAQQKTYEAYKVVRDNNMLETKEGYAVLGDLNLKNQQYSVAANNYYKALQLEPDNEIYKNNLAICYRLLGHIKPAGTLFKDILIKNPENKEAMLGLGSLEIDKKNFEKARSIFRYILCQDPCYKPAKIAIAHSYIANDERLSALETLESVPEDDEVKMLKAQVYYDMNMLSDSKDILKRTSGKEPEVLKAKIKREDAITLTPSYVLFVSQLADEFNLDYQRYGLRVSQNGPRNSNVFMEYNVFWYTSGAPYFLSNVANEFKGGVHARPTEKFEYKADIGVKAFQFGGGMAITDSWAKYYFNDKFNLKLGFKRDNLEQSYLSAVGEIFNGAFTGRVANNRLHMNFEAKLPKQFYAFGTAAYGVLTAQNLDTNQYIEGMVGVGRLVYNNPKNKWIQKVGMDLVSYNVGYQYNLLDLYDAAGVLYGGYFSPGFFTADTLNVKIEGENKKYHLRYGVSGFAGIQNAQWPNQTNLTWGFAPYLAYDLNDHITFNASYNYFNYADVQRHYLMFNAVIRGFKRHV